MLEIKPISMETILKITTWQIRLKNLQPDQSGRNPIGGKGRKRDRMHQGSLQRFYWIVTSYANCY